MANENKTHVAIVTPRVTKRRRAGSSMVRVSAAKSGTVPIGSMATNNKINSLMNACSKKSSP
jgi:hypothetical protein